MHRAPVLECCFAAYHRDISMCNDNVKRRRYTLGVDWAIMEMVPNNKYITSPGPAGVEFQPGDNRLGSLVLSPEIGQHMFAQACSTEIRYRIRRSAANVSISRWVCTRRHRPNQFHLHNVVAIIAPRGGGGGHYYSHFSDWKWRNLLVHLLSSIRM